MKIAGTPFGLRQGNGRVDLRAIATCAAQLSYHFMAMTSNLIAQLNCHELGLQHPWHFIFIIDLIEEARETITFSCEVHPADFSYSRKTILIF